MINGDQEENWFAVRVRPNFEQTVCDGLAIKGFNSFLPTYREPRVWSDRVKFLDLPLFPGYLFCRTAIEHRLPILTTPGVRDIVGFGRTPAPVSQAEIEAVQRFIANTLDLRPWPFLQTGEKVVIEKGPLAGVEGVVQEFKGKFRVIVTISLLQRSIAAEVDGTWVRSLQPSLHLTAKN